MYKSLFHWQTMHENTDKHAHDVLLRFIRKHRCKYAHACMTNPTVSCSIYGKTRAKYTTDAQPQQCQYAIIPCFYVCYENVAFFTVFYRIKWTFHKITFLHVFYRVNHKRGSQNDPKMDPKMDPESSNMRVFPCVLSCMCVKHTCFTV